MRVLHTIGYEGASIDAFIGKLKDSGITLLVDIRDYPLSRKKGFSKTALMMALQDVGIRYEHWRDLGAPRPIRHALRESRDWNAYERRYAQILDESGAVLEELAGRLEGEVACLMCFEQDHHVCHRSLVAERMEDEQLIGEVAHLQL